MTITEIEFKEGQIYGMRDGSHIRIMAIAEGYIMARRKGCAPFLCTKKELIKKMQEWNSARLYSINK